MILDEGGINIGVNVKEDKIIDKTIIMTLIKDKRATRTIVSGLCFYMSDEKIKSFIKNIKKKLGTECIEINDEISTKYGFRGDHRKTIKEILVNTENIPNKNIKI